MDADSHKIRVVLVDDSEVIREEIGNLLATLDGVKLLAIGHNGEEAVQLCSDHKPDILLIDIAMPVMNGLTATRVILSKQPDIRVVAMSGLDDPAVVQEMITVGAAGYILKDAHPEELFSTLQDIYNGKSVLSSQLMKPLLQNAVTVKTPSDFGLTRREMDVLLAMRQGLNNGQVAEKLSISTATVRFHITNIIEKLGAENRTEALIIAAREKLI